MSGRCKYSNAATRRVNIHPPRENLFYPYYLRCVCDERAVFRLSVCKFKLRAYRGVVAAHLVRAIDQKTRIDTCIS